MQSWFSYQRYIFLSVLILFGSLATLFASTALEVQSSLDKPQLSMGDYARYEIYVRSPHPVSLELDAWEEAVSANFDVEEIEQGQQVTRENQEGTLWSWRFWPKHSGEWDVPPVHVQTIPAADSQEKSKPESKSTQSFKVLVGNPMVSEEAPRFRDLKPEVDVPFSMGWQEWLLILAILGLLGGGAFYYYSRQNKVAPSTPKEPEEEPHKRAFRRLNELQSFMLTHPTEVQSYYFQLSEIFRDFLERRFDFAATSMTTQEFLPALKRCTPYSETDQERIQVLCQKSDIIKYAEALPSEKEVQENYQEVYTLIEKVVYQQPAQNNQQGEVYEV